MPLLPHKPGCASLYIKEKWIQKSRCCFPSLPLCRGKTNSNKAWASSLAGFLSAVVARDLELSSEPESELCTVRRWTTVFHTERTIGMPQETPASGASNRQQWVALGVEMFFLFDLLN